LVTSGRGALDTAIVLARIIEAMRWIGFFATLILASSVSAQQAIQLPAAPAAPAAAQAADTFRFVSDGPAGGGWSRGDEIARKYFNDNLQGLFERTIAVDGDIPERATLRWIFTGPRAGLTVELTASKVRIVERYYDSMALYEGQGNYPEKTVFTDERQYTGQARTLTVIADAHLAARVLVNGQPMLTAPVLFDVTRHQLMLAAPRTAHEVVEGTLLKSDVKSSTITINPSEIHQTMLGFGGSPSIPAYDELSEEGKRTYWQMLKRYNLLLSREYPMGTELKPDMSNLENMGDATPHYYGDNFPNSELSSFDYSRHVLAIGGSVIYELWALPQWATVANSGPHAVDTWNKPMKQVANPDEYARIVVTYCKKAQAATGSAPLIVGLENEVDQPTEVFSAMALALRRELDKAGFTETKIHMADASYMFLGIDRAKALSRNGEAWKAIDFSAAHEYDFQEFIANPNMYDARMKAMHEAAAGKPFLATEICINDPHYQEPSYRIAFAVAQLYHKNLTELDAEALMYCWLLLDVEEPTFAGSRSLMAPDRTRGWVPVATSYQLRVLGAFSRHIVKGMQRIGAESGDAELLTTAFADGLNETLVVVNRSTTARRLTVEGGTHPWAEMERTGLEEENAVSAVPAEVVVQPGEIVVLSTMRAE
jgi:O-glycosyl hydrolase